MKIDLLHKDIKILFDSLDLSTQSQITKVLELLAERGPGLRMPYSKKLQKDLYELRIKSIQNVRIFYTFYEGNVVLLHAVLKKTQRLDKRDLKTALHRVKLLLR